ncbi:DUF3168 domain-containing protein [Sphingomonas sp. 1P08PE]|uniref:tail completion protein gp17 n=1 Tax=Sphingomonas sp. 1P08PE TaxID=554122 RepID=UPI00399F08A8
MAVDSTLPVRRAILTAMKNSPAINELLPAEHIFTSVPPPSPPWPFSRYENYGPSSPIIATCLDGQELNVRIHVFAKPREVAGITVETGEDHACRIMGRVADGLDQRRYNIDRGQMLVMWRGSLVLPDGDEADAFHGIVNLRIRTSTA